MITAILLFLQIFAGQDTGSLIIDHPDRTATVIIGKFQQNLTSGDTLRLPFGDFQLRFGFPSHQDLLVDVSVRPGSPARLRLVPEPIRSEHDRERHSVYPTLLWQANLIVETDATSRLLLNGLPIDSSLARLRVEPGQYRIESHDAFGRRREKTLTVSSTRLTYVDMSAPQFQDRLRTSSYVPGLSQYHRNELLKSTLIVGAVTGLAAFSITESIRALHAQDRYDATRKAYDNVFSPQNLIILAERGERQADELNRVRLNRNMAMSALAGVYVWNIWDGRRPGRAGYRTDPPAIRPFANPEEAGIRLSW